MDSDVHRRERIEAITLKIVGITFFALAAYIAFEAAKALIHRELPDPSYIGIGLAVLSLIVMPLLAGAKRRVAVRIHSRACKRTLGRPTSAPTCPGFSSAVW